MTRDDIIRIAREADIDWHRHWNDEENRLERFAALVAAHEREACAKMAEAFHRHGYDFTGNEELHEAIRSRT